MTDPAVPPQPPHVDEVVLVDYDPEWPALYDQWSKRILEVCGDLVTEIHHIGSTAVPGLLAKPIIDIMPGVARFEDGFALVDPLQALGFEARGEFGIPRRHYFNRTDVHVHVFPVGEGQWHDQLAFRDHLRTHEDTRSAYAALKRHLQQRYRFDRETYSDAKSDFIAEILDQARR